MYSKLILMLLVGCLTKVIVKYMLKPQITAQHCLIISFFLSVISQITSHLSQ